MGMSGTQTDGTTRCVVMNMSFRTFGLLFALMTSASAEELYIATPLTQSGIFTKGIEGPACDREGHIYAVNFGVQQTIGKVTPSGEAETFVTLPGKSTGNGIRITREGILFVADYVEHKVLRIDPASRSIAVHAFEPLMNQPNDLALAPDESLYASDPNWKESTGQIWLVTKEGKTRLVAKEMGTTNGIDLSPDGKTLYVNESIQRNVWAFDVNADGTLQNKRLLKAFPDFGFDGMRCDVEGNLYITRHGKGTVVKLSPTGEVLREIDVLGPHPTNLCFGGPDGRTVYVTEVEHGRIVQFRVESPGQEWKVKQ